MQCAPPQHTQHSPLPLHTCCSAWSVAKSSSPSGMRSPASKAFTISAWTAPAGTACVYARDLSSKVWAQSESVRACPLLHQAYPQCQRYRPALSWLPAAPPAALAAVSCRPICFLGVYSFIILLVCIVVVPELSRLSWTKPQHHHFCSKALVLWSGSASASSAPSCCAAVACCVVLKGCVSQERATRGRAARGQQRQQRWRQQRQRSTDAKQHATQTECFWCGPNSPAGGREEIASRPRCRGTIVVSGAGSRGWVGGWWGRGNVDEDDAPSLALTVPSAPSFAQTTVTHSSRTTARQCGGSIMTATSIKPTCATTTWCLRRLGQCGQTHLQAHPVARWWWWWAGVALLLAWWVRASPAVLLGWWGVCTVDTWASTPWCALLVSMMPDARGGGGVVGSCEGVRICVWVDAAAASWPTSTSTHHHLSLLPTGMMGMGPMGMMGGPPRPWVTGACSGGSRSWVGHRSRLLSILPARAPPSHSIDLINTHSTGDMVRQWVWAWDQEDRWACRDHLSWEGPRRWLRAGAAVDPPLELYRDPPPMWLGDPWWG